MKKAAVISLVLLAISSACARKYASGPLPAAKEPEKAAAVPAQVDDRIQEALAKRPQLPVPFKIGVYFASGEWDGPDKDAILAMEDDLIATGLVKNFFYMSPRTVQIAANENDPLGRFGPMSPRALEALRVTAARHGADALLVIHERTDDHEEPNWFSPLYLTIAGAFLVPGTDIRITDNLEGMLWDVRNEFLYASVEAEGTRRASRPGFLQGIGRERLEKEARADATADFRKAFLSSVRALGE